MLRKVTGRRIFIENPNVSPLGQNEVLPLVTDSLCFSARVKRDFDGLRRNSPGTRLSGLAQPTTTGELWWPDLPSRRARILLAR